MITVGIVDDHSLMRDGLKLLLTKRGLKIGGEYNSGNELMTDEGIVHLDIILMDISMPDMQGTEVTQWVKDNHPKIKVIAMTALNDELSIIRMLKAGAKAYILKNSGEDQLVNAIHSVYKLGHYHTDLVSGTLIRSLNQQDLKQETSLGLTLTENEIEFLRHLCSELTNKEIADKMFVSPRTSEGWSKKLCEKLNVKSRVGLAAFAIRNNLC